MCKIDLCLELSCDACTPRKLLAGVERYLVAAVLYGQQHTRQRRGNVFNFLIVDELRCYTPGPALYGIHQSAPNLVTHHGAPQSPAVTYAQQ